MKVETVVGSITVVLVLCSSALAANPNQQGLSQAQIDQGCTKNGRYVSCPSQMQRVEAAPMQRVEVAPMKRVEAAPMQRVEVAPMKRVEVAPMQRVEVAPMQRVEVAPIKNYRPPTRPRTTTQAQADRRGQVIDPKGQGLNQAQINAMEQQRRLMWNATGGSMVYR